MIKKTVKKTSEDGTGNLANFIVEDDEDLEGMLKFIKDDPPF